MEILKIVVDQSPLFPTIKHVIHKTLIMGIKIGSSLWHLSAGFHQQRGLKLELGT